MLMEIVPSYSSIMLPVEFVANPINETTTSSENKKLYIRTDLTSWAIVKDGEDGRTIEPNPYTGEW